ncbi:MAG: DNA-3-methyladenine glycosylase [Candidatus Aenigmatarchaeota archaeon]
MTLGRRLTRNFFTKPTLRVAKELLGKYLVRNYKGKILIGKIVETEAYIGPKDKASHAYSKKEQNPKEKLKIINENWERIKNYVENKKLFIKKILSLKKAKVTKRNLAEYLRGGHIYIYLVYGNYYQLNITTYKEGYPECVLIRSLEPVFNLKNPKGPGRLCEELKLDSSFWGEDLVKSKRIYIVDSWKDSRMNSEWGSRMNHEWGLQTNPKDTHKKISRSIHEIYSKNLGKKYSRYIREKYLIVRTTRIGIDYAEECKFLKWRFYLKNNPWVSKK